MREQIEVIVAEDNVVQRTYMRRLIENAGVTCFKVIEAEDGQAALELLKTSRAEILITDYQMPGLNGVELTRAARSLDLGRYVHIILITGTDMGGYDVRADALNAGADDFLNKEKDPTALKARLRTAMRLIHHGKELEEQHRAMKEANDRINEDLAAAAHAQRNLLPDINTNILGAHVASVFVPSSVVSGDMFGCFPLNDSQIGFYAVDVSGHGIRASLMSVAIGYLITPEFFTKSVLDEDGIPRPARLVRELNERFCTDAHDDYFTMLCGVMDTRRVKLFFCQAGYPSPYYVDANGNATPIGDGGFPVGMFSGVDYEDGNIGVDLDGMLLCCSDGAFEAENNEGIPFGEQRMEEIVKQIYHEPADKVPEKIVKALADWRGRKPLEDDLTVVAVKRNMR
ncbi:SpoIIE family protein phosphatase [Actibacterium lipolyticum]|uniref:Phosphoserine phosphatase RsbP n=1 Tax=Actibacterium lipolyticum TaxID=1524263 RepID=A0A238JNF9_9RHOB|nr:SpoIIE family protein phosphatase [Actibacterium lipolyticum]SMX31316.1 Phosphoserine phosphatase RsbP [Actibacterium lipolyticum]